MIKVKDHHTGWIFDPWSHIGPKRLKMLENSWSGVFRKYLLEKLPIEKVASHFDSEMGRPTKELYTVIGALILQQLHDLSDPDVTRAAAFSIDWHYALDITGDSDENTYFCDRTLRRYRKILIEEGLDKILFETLTDTLINKFKVDTSKQRLDSTYIRSNMRILNQIDLFLLTIQKFLRKLRHSNAKLYALLPESEFVARYIDKDSENLFSYVKPSGSSKTIRDLAKDILYLVEFFRSYKAVRNLPEYGLLERILKESCIVPGSGDNKTVELKPAKEIASDSLQNPSDPDAGYDAHKGSGYQAQAMETYQTVKKDKPKPDLITYVDLEPANIHDSHALMPAINDTSERKCSPDNLVCDSLYGSDDNVQQAAVKNVEVIAPVSGKPNSHEITLANFEIDTESNFVTRCPEGTVPVNVCRTRKNKLIAKFTKNTCFACPRLKDCPVVIGKKASYLRYDDKMLRNAQRQAYEKTKDFKDKYRWRAGIEATMSHLKKDLGLKRLRVRGFASVRFTVILKALGLNILRCVKALETPLFRSINRLSTSLSLSGRLFFHSVRYFIVKEHFFCKNPMIIVA